MGDREVDGRTGEGIRQKGTVIDGTGEEYRGRNECGERSDPVPHRARGVAMTRKEIAKALAKAERAEDRWDRALITAFNKVRVYRRRAKYYRQRLEDTTIATGAHRIRRKIRADVLEV
jgi:hypothetical protein